jgi:hypothetical protein
MHIPMSVPEGFVEQRTRGRVSWLRSDLVGVPQDLLWGAVEPLAGARGRGGVGTLELPGGQVAVVRPFRRGGAFGKVLGERYPGPARVRRELEALVRLRRSGVPVASPLAALALRHGSFWRLRLLTELVADARPLPSFCADYPEARRWAIESAAVSCRLAFAAGLRHPDLHPDNILCTRQEQRVRAVLIDLDRAEVGQPPTQAQRDSMLVRMARYLVRHRRRLSVAPSWTDHLRFLRALGSDRATRRTDWLRLSAQLRRELRRRGIAGP